MTNTITVANQIQKVLFDCELSGQVSDGHWENSRPLDHWKVVCDAEVVVGTPNLNFTPLRKYNFKSKSLLDVVSDRMIVFAKMAIKFPQLSSNAVRLTDYGQWAWEKEDHYTNEKLEYAAIGVTTYDELQTLINDLSSITYTLRDLKKDLKVIKDIFTDAYIRGNR